MADTDQQQPARDDVIDFRPAQGMNAPGPVTPQPQPVPQPQPQAPSGGGIDFTPAWGPGVTGGSWPGAQEQPKSVTDFVINQAPRSAADLLTNVVSAAVHPIRTGNAMGNLIAGTFKQVARGAGLEMPENESDQVARAFEDYIGKRYGSTDKAWESLYHDPAGVLTDFSTALTGVGGVIGGAGKLGELARLGRAAETVSTVGKGLSAAGEWTNPAKLATAPVAAVVKKLAPKPLPAFDPSTATFEGPPVTPPPAAAAKNITGMLAAGGITQFAVEALTHHLLGSLGAGALAAGAIKYIPMLLKSNAGQQMLAAIGPGSTPAAVASVARDLVPALNTLYTSQQTQQQQTPQPQSQTGFESIDRIRGLEPFPVQRAKGGMVNPELARIQRERLGLPGIHEMLNRK